MVLTEKQMNLFDVDKKYKFAHCISSDCALGAGIAVEFKKRFNMKTKLLRYPEEERRYPTCILIDNVFNLITKDKYWGKPTYETLEKSLYKMKEIIAISPDQFKYIAMPKIGCGLDKLSWGKVKQIIESVFEDLDIQIIVCYI